jgi:hypothetical protein
MVGEEIGEEGGGVFPKCIIKGLEGVKNCLKAER